MNDYFVFLPLCSGNLFSICSPLSPFGSFQVDALSYQYLFSFQYLLLSVLSLYCFLPHLSTNIFCTLSVFLFRSKSARFCFPLLFYTPPPYSLCYTFVTFLYLHPQYYCYLTCHIISSYTSYTSLYMHPQCCCLIPIPYSLIQLLPI